MRSSFPKIFYSFWRSFKKTMSRWIFCYRGTTQIFEHHSFIVSREVAEAPAPSTMSITYNQVVMVYHHVDEIWLIKWNIWRAAGTITALSIGQRLKRAIYPSKIYQIKKTKLMLFLIRTVSCQENSWIFNIQVLI